MGTLKLRDAMVEAQRTGQPQPINAGRCEAKVWSKQMQARGYCGKDGRWLVDHQIRCGEHKVLGWPA